MFDKTLQEIRDLNYKWQTEEIEQHIDAKIELSKAEDRETEE